MSDVTHILSKIEQGDPLASEQLLILVYDELRKLAAAKLAHERPCLTLQPTALVHEAYIRLVDVEKAQRWDSRGHFFAAAAEAMRRILVENARRHRSLKHGGNANRMEFDERTFVYKEETFDLVSLDEAIAKLEQHDLQASQLVKLRFFAGLGHQEAAEAMGVGRRAADRLWALARAWLYRELQAAQEQEFS
jgi:RNA polymerase sigma factor (TIGR02999 family)